MHGRTWTTSALLLVTWLMPILLFPCGLSAQAVPQAQVKAAFLINFAKFVEWPSETFSEADAPLIIGILGDDPFGSVLDEAARGKVIDGRRVHVRRLKGSEDWSNAHILFISDSEKDILPSILQRLNHSPVLIVSDIARFCRSGGMVCFISESNRVQFEINLGSAQRQGLQISSKLLTLATNVHER